MRYLFLDASETATVCQYGDDSGFVSRSFATDRNLAACISMLCDEMLSQAGQSFADLDRLAICTGPGSLTGLRVAAAFFRTLAWVGNKPICGIDLFSWATKTLQSQKHGKKAVLVIPTLIDQAFVAQVDVEQQIVHPPQLQPRDQVSVSNGFSLRCDLPGLKRLEPTPEALHAMIKSQPPLQNFNELLGLLPLYIIPSQAERKLEEGQ